VIRLLNLLAVAGLVASAIYAYSIKYDTLYQGGQVSKLKSGLHAERQAIAVLRAEWQLLTRPDRLQAAVEKHLALEPIGISHLGRLADLPARPERGDEIGRLLAATATPKDKGTVAEPRTTGSITRTVVTTRTPNTASR
jgi:hypothetical protein